MSPNTVTVSMPYYGYARSLRRAVESVLDQTHEDLRLIVINDGGGTSEWRFIAGINDPRLIRFDLPKNHGRYYCDAVSLASCSTGGLFAVHDADDYCDRRWLSRLVENIDDHVAVFSDQLIHHGNRVSLERVSPELVSRVRLPKMTRLAHHAGLYRVDALRMVGGHNPMFRIGYDTMLVNLVRMVGSCGYVPEPLYHRMTRFGSLSTSRTTGAGSWQRQVINKTLEQLYTTLVNLAPNEVGPYLWAMIPADILGDFVDDVTRLRVLRMSLQQPIEGNR